MFENTNNSMGHATIAIARGNNVTTIDPYWSEAGNQKNEDKHSLESTFDGAHGNVTSLYDTLSRENPNNSKIIFSQLARLTMYLVSF